MYKIFFSVNNNTEQCILPYAPVGLHMGLAEQNNEVYSGLSYDYRRIGTLQLRTMDWSGLLPVNRKYRDPFIVDGAKLNGWWYVHFFERWRDRKVPLRVMLWDNDGNDLRVNMPCTVDSFEWTIERNGYLNYTISLTEYRFVTED